MLLLNIENLLASDPLYLVLIFFYYHQNAIVIILFTIIKIQCLSDFILFTYPPICLW